MTADWLPESSQANTRRTYSPGSSNVAFVTALPFSSMVGVASSNVTVPAPRNLLHTTPNRAGRAVALALRTPSSLAHTMTGVGGATVGLEGAAFLLLVLGVKALVIVLTELTSNTATTATFLPIVASVAVGLGENPLMLVVPAALAASYAFMMPVATPPNAIVFGSGHITIPQMVRAGILLNMLGGAVITAFSYTVVMAVLGIEAGVAPDWALGGAGG